MERYNERFAVPPARTQDLHRPLRTTAPRLNDILCHREQRYVGTQLTFHYDRKQIILEQTEVPKGLEGQYVELFDYRDRPLEVCWRGHVLSYRVFSKDQRVSHTAIVENKRLGHARLPSSRDSRTSGWRSRLRPTANTPWIGGERSSTSRQRQAGRFAHCQFLEEDAKTPIKRKLNLPGQQKLFELAQRCGVQLTPEECQQIQHGIDIG